MPLYRRLPKRGFNNPFSKDFAEINLSKLQKAIDAGRLDAELAAARKEPGEPVARKGVGHSHGVAEDVLNP